MGGLRSWLAEADQVDNAVYAAVAGTDTPNLDQVMGRISTAANYSRLSITAAAILALSCGERGRRAAVYGLASIATTATVVNVVIKPLGRRQRPDRDAHDAPIERHIKMPVSRSFPSGHTAAAVAFANGAGAGLPAAALPLHLLATVVGYSRVHTGVHYPGDVLAGAVIGAVTADLTVGALVRRSAKRGDARHLLAG